MFLLIKARDIKNKLKRLDKNFYEQRFVKSRLCNFIVKRSLQKFTEAIDSKYGLPLLWKEALILAVFVSRLPPLCLARSSYYFRCCSWFFSLSRIDLVRRISGNSPLEVSNLSIFKQSSTNPLRRLAVPKRWDFCVCRILFSA